MFDKKWLKDVSIRAVKTVAQAAVGVIGTSTAMGDVDWMFVLSSSVLAGIVSVLMSVANYKGEQE